MTKNPLSAKQSLVLTGLGSEEFDNCVRAVIQFHSRFASHLPSDTLQPWSPIKDDEHLCLELSNRYYTPDNLVSQYEEASVSDTIDPMGLLRAKGNGLRHTEDNDVLYFERLPDEQRG